MISWVGREREVDLGEEWLWPEYIVQNSQQFDKKWEKSQNKYKFQIAYLCIIIVYSTNMYKFYVSIEF